MSAKFPRGGGGSKPILSHPSIHDIVLIFTYVAPEKSSIYSPEYDDGIVILKERNIHD